MLHFLNPHTMADNKKAPEVKKDPIKFTNTTVAEKYTTTAKNDFQVRLPDACKVKWAGMFSNITPEVADELISQGYNRISVKS